MGKKRSPAYKRTKRFLKQLVGQDVWSKAQVSINQLRFGDWVICPDTINAQSVVYSLGVGEDIDFDKQLIKQFDVLIHAFDPTPNSIEWLKTKGISENFDFHPFGISILDGELKLYPRVNRRGRKSKVMYTLIDGGGTQEGSITINVKQLPTVMAELGHNTIDLLKMDIEGAEFDVLDQILDVDIDIRQILVEFHHRFKGIGKARMSQMLKRMDAAGYKIFFMDDRGWNYSFIKV